MVSSGYDFSIVAVYALTGDLNLNWWYSYSNSAIFDGTNTIITIDTDLGTTTSGYFVGAAGGIASHAEGLNSQAIGNYSHAQNLSFANGAFSHSEGDSSYAAGETSHAEGGETYAGGYASHSEGEATTTYGESSHAEGIGTVSEGDWSHVEGDGSRTVGMSSHAEGYLNISYADNSHAEGISNIAGITAISNNNFTILDEINFPYIISIPGDCSRYFQNAVDNGHKITFYNMTGGDDSQIAFHDTYLHAVLNIDSVNFDGTYTNFNIDGDLRGRNAGQLVDSELAKGSHVEGYSSQAIGNYSHAEGESSIAFGEGSHSENTSLAYGDFSHSEGTAFVEGLANNAHAEGNDTYAGGKNSHSENDGSQANGNGSHAEGNSVAGQFTWAFEYLSGNSFITVAGIDLSDYNFNDFIILENFDSQRAVSRTATFDSWDGFDSKINIDSALSNDFVSGMFLGREMGEYSHAQGRNTQALGKNSFSAGNSTFASGTSSVAIGVGVTAEADQSMIFGTDSSTNNIADSIQFGFIGGVICSSGTDLVLTSPDNNKWRLQVSNIGVLSVVPY